MYSFACHTHTHGSRAHQKRTGHFFAMVCVCLMRVCLWMETFGSAVSSPAFDTNRIEWTRVTRKTTKKNHTEIQADLRWSELDGEKKYNNIIRNGNRRLIAAVNVLLHRIINVLRAALPPTPAAIIPSHRKEENVARPSFTAHKRM